METIVYHEPFILEKLYHSSSILKGQDGSEPQKFCKLLATLDWSIKATSLFGRKSILWTIDRNLLQRHTGECVSRTVVYSGELVGFDCRNTMILESALQILRRLCRIQS
ncbi:hypothetical protein Gasu2_69570 [Galdieria sulphuraria]|nr:hypothetical protein Gasu2_69570 [Galdieria sulphuraria]